MVASRDRECGSDELASDREKKCSTIAEVVTRVSVGEPECSLRGFRNKARLPEIDVDKGWE